MLERDNKMACWLSASLSPYMNMCKYAIEIYWNRTRYKPDTTVYGNVAAHLTVFISVNNLMDWTRACTLDTICIRGEARIPPEYRRQRKHFHAARRWLSIILRNTCRSTHACKCVRYTLGRRIIALRTS